MGGVENVKLDCFRAGPTGLINNAALRVLVNEFLTNNGISMWSVQSSIVSLKIPSETSVISLEKISLDVFQGISTILDASKLKRWKGAAKTPKLVQISPDLNV